MLIEGRWDWIIEFMHRCLKLESFEAADHGFWAQYIDVNTAEDNGENLSIMSNRIEKYEWVFNVVQDYVLRRPGARHPHLSCHATDLQGLYDEIVATGNDDESEDEKDRLAALYSQELFEK